MANSRLKKEFPNKSLMYRIIKAQEEEYRYHIGKGEDSVITYEIMIKFILGAIIAFIATILSYL